MNEGIELILNLVRLIQEAQDEFSDEELESMLAMLTEAAEILMQQPEVPEETPVQPSVNRTDTVPGSEFPSSNVNGMQYNPDTGEMLVQFHGPYPNARGPVYSYQKIPPFLFDVLSRGAVAPKTSGKNRYHEWKRGVTPSLGASVNSILKAGGFDYRRVA